MSRCTAKNSESSKTWSTCSWRTIPKPSSALENVFLDDWREAGGDDERLRVAIDQVASLTDTSALTLHSLLC